MVRPTFCKCGRRIAKLVRGLTWAPAMEPARWYHGGGWRNYDPRMARRAGGAGLRPSAKGRRVDVQMPRARG